MSYPILYQAGETNFSHLGLGVLKDTISAVVSEDLNGKFELDLVYAYNNKLSKSLVSGNIIKVDAGNILKEQLFTIAQVSKTLDGKISVHAEHVSYIMQDLTLKPKTVVYQQDAQNALKQLLNAIKETDHGFTVVSDISTISSSTWSVPDFKTPRDVLAGVDGSVLDNWGGEYKFDNRRISLLEQRGSYANTVIAYGRNLLDFEQETSILETYTSIYPVVVKTEKDAEVTHTLPELVVDSQYLDKYANRKSFLVDFSDKFDDKNTYSDDKLRTLANAYIKANKVGVPKVTMTIKTLDLAKMVTDDYKAGRVERLDLADTVKVYFDRLGITTEAKVVGVKWNVLKESYDEYVLGERKATFGTVIRGSIAEVKAVADSAKKDAITALVSADGKNTNYYGNSSDGAPPTPKKGDIWFVKDGDKTTIKTWNGTAWVDLVSSDWQEIFEIKLTEELTKSKEDLDLALAEKDAALKDLDTKIAAEMTVIDQSIEQGKLDTATVQRRADEAVAKANQNIKEIGELDVKLIDTKELTDKALADVNKIASENKVLVDKAQVDATKAIADAKIAYDKTTENSGKIVTVNQEIDKIKGEITQKVSQTDFDKSLSRITQAESSITQNANAITQKVSSTDVENILTGKAYATKSELTQTSNSLTSTISGVQKNVDALGTNTAFAYSSDGTDRFTTAYPNLNLLDIKSNVVFGQFLDWPTGTLNSNPVRATLDYVPVNQNMTYSISSDWSKTTWLSVFAYGNRSDAKATYIYDGTVNKWFDLSTVGRFVTKNTTVTIPQGIDFVRISFFSADTTKPLALQSLLDSKPKFEPGTIATLWMPSNTEVKPSDYPSYVGRSLKYSTNPSDYKWEVNSGYTAAKADASQIQVTQLSQNLDGFKTTVSSTYLTTSNASNTYPTKDAVAGTYLNKGDASNLYPTKTTVTSQINQSATDITSSVQSWTNDKLTGYSTIKQTNDSITSTIAGVQVEIDKKANQSQVTQLSQDLNGFKTTVSSTYLTTANASNTYPTKVAVADTYPTKITVATQISQSATDITSSVQSWTNGKLNGYSTIQQTDNSITSAVSGKADRSQVTQLSDQITSTVKSLTNESIVTVDMIKDATTKHPDYPDMIVLGIPATIGESYTVSTNKPNRGTESAPIADVFYTQAWNAPPSSQLNGAWSGHSVTTKAVINRIYLVFRDTNFLNSFANGEYWVKAIATPASQSQITQLATDINLRVTKDSVVNQINISNEGILIAGSKVQITGQTYIENGVITSAKIQDLSASKLTAGTINGSVINVININAGNITSGTLSADRIAANSITATHISIASLSALSANLGTVTAGTINAATVNIININAGSITTGTLNADRIGANSITADKIKATSLDLFINDAYTNVQADGMRLQSKAQIIFGPWIDVNGSIRSTQGLYMGGFGGGTKHVALTRSNGTTFLLRAEVGMDYGANQNVAIGDLNLYDNVQFWESARIHGNLINEGYIAMGGSVQEASIQYDKNVATMNFRIPGGRSGSYYWFNQKVTSAGSFDSASRLSLKNVKGNYQGNALDDICNTEIVEYSYKNSPDDRQLSPIIDDINEIKKYHLPDIINDGEAVNLYAMGSLSWLAIKQLAQKLENIEEKLNAIA